jgi:hypothetical protein
MTEQKIEAFWRDATAEDIAKVMKGEKVEARFRDVDTSIWSVSRFLGGYDATCPNSLHWISNNANQWKFCQVYDPPQWYTDKPDPGEGYRLLEKFPDEELESEDDWFTPESKIWSPSIRACRGERQDEDIWYRRRIEPVKHDAGSTCASNIPKGWTALSLDEPRLASDAYWSALVDSWVLIGDTRLESANREKWPAIRLHDVNLVQGRSYFLPSGLTLEVYKNGFEVF